VLYAKLAGSRISLPQMPLGSRMAAEFGNRPFACLFDTK
jgi:hypothetical protein